MILAGMIGYTSACGDSFTVDFGDGMAEGAGGTGTGGIDGSGGSAGKDPGNTGMGGFPVPGSPMPSEPEDGFVVYHPEPFLAWTQPSPVPVDKHRFCLSTIPFSNDQDCDAAQDTPKTPFYVPLLTTSGVEHYWKVSACAGPNCSPFAGHRTLFYVDTRTAEFRMEGDLTDASGHNHVGVLQGATFGVGLIGQGLHTGMDAYMLIPNHQAFNYGTSPFTFSLFARPSSTGTEQILLQRANASNGYTLKRDSSGRFVFTSTHCPDLMSSPKPDNEWHHALVTRNGGTISLTMNGVTEASAACAGDMTVPGSAIAVGCNVPPHSVCTNPFPGDIDEVTFSHAGWNEQKARDKCRSVLAKAGKSNPQTLCQNL